MRINKLLLASLAAAAVRGVAAQPPELKWLQSHGWLMWISFGFLFPLGTLLIRYSRHPTSTLSSSRVILLFYLHVIVQCVAVVAGTAGIVVLITQTGASWNYTHQRLGLALWIISMLMPFIGLARPGKGKESRLYWFVIHWVFGTAILFLGIINCYIGINAYQYITKRSLRSLNIAFSIQVAFMTMLYFLQDRWTYILGQRFSESSPTPMKASQTIGMDC